MNIFTFLFLNSLCSYFMMYPSYVMQYSQISDFGYLAVFNSKVISSLGLLNYESYKVNSSYQEIVRKHKMFTKLM